MMKTKKTLLVALPTAALVLGGGISVGLAATAGQSPTVPRPASQQMLVTTAKTGTAQLTAQPIQVKHTDPHGQSPTTTSASAQRNRSRDGDCDQPGLNAATPTVRALPITAGRRSSAGRRMTVTRTSATRRITAVQHTTTETGQPGLADTRRRSPRGTYAPGGARLGTFRWLGTARLGGQAD